MTYLRMQSDWRDTQKVALELGVSNIAILKTLRDAGIIYRDNRGNHLVSPVYKKEKVARHMERSFIKKQDQYEQYGKSPQRFYTVVQLSQKGINKLKEILAKQAAA